MSGSLEQISRLVSYWLRHNPTEAGLVADDFGWVSINLLLLALKDRNHDITQAALIELNQSFDKIRWEIDLNGDKIRATHGHSFSVAMDEKIENPPDTLYHGTSSKSIPQILEKGLLSMDRAFVHLSDNVEAAIKIGQRHGKPIIIEIPAERLAKEGKIFYQTGDKVWLTDNISSEHLHFRPWFPVVKPSNHAITELKREIGNGRNHLLYHYIDKLKLIWQSSVSDDCLFEDQYTGECFSVHLTYTRRKQEVDGYPKAKNYGSLDEWLREELYTDQHYFYKLV